MSKINIGLSLAAVLFFVTGIFHFNRSFSNSSALYYQKFPGIGDEAPDIDLKSPSGKSIKLSSLRGKIVLLDFWASWCGPCRAENPNVVDAYNKYKKATFKTAKGFEIYSVSLDTDKDKWKDAIKKDGLKWKYHVSDLKGWNSSAGKLYGINSIPNNFLIGPDGKILAINLRGLELHTAIDEYIEKL
ncbi:MAG: peroxiredoxin family protein [Bacteroidota bacterium]